MKMRTRKIFSTIALTVVLTVLMSMCVFADFNSVMCGLNGKIRGVATVFIAFCALATAIMYMMSSVNPKLKDKAKDALIGLIIGIVIFALSSQIEGIVNSFFL